MQIKATQKFIVMSPRKLRLVVPLVKNLSPTDAFNKLPFVKKRAALPLRKVIGTAIANAKQKGVSETDLEFSEIQINEGPRLKRWRAGARGRAKPYKKRMSHIRVVLTTKEQKKQGTEEKISKSESKEKKSKIGGKKDKKPATQRTLRRKKGGAQKKSA